MTYTFIPSSKEEEPPTIQEKFFEIFYDQDFGLDMVTKYHLACTDFSEQYKLKPPYSNYSSFSVMMSKRHRK